MISLKDFLVAVALISPGVIAAQKLPKVQQVSLRAPADIKIDGKPLEWHNQYQASNVSCRIFYTLCNDDENLYLVVRTQDKYGNQKILQGGVTLTVDAAAKGEKPNPITVTYPAIMDKANKQHDMLTSHARYYYNGLNTDTITNKQEIDSIINLTNKEFVSYFKDIQISGIKEITDPQISVYNTDGIKVAAQFDKKMIYTYELAIPLKYLGNSGSPNAKLRYNIKLNSGATVIVSGIPRPIIIGEVNPDMMYQNNATDFWGYYILAGKGRQ